MPRGPKPLKTKLRVNEFYCVGCRHRVACDRDDIKYRPVRSPRRKTGKAPAVRCVCKHCDTKLTKFIKQADVKKFQ